MLPWYFLALLATSVVSADFPCKDGDKIFPKLINDPSELVGKWSYVYHWDNVNKEKSILPPNTEDYLQCSYLEIAPASQDFVEEKLKPCGNEKYPFKAEDGKLKVNVALMGIKDAIIFMGEKESWLMASCKKALRVEVKKVTDDVVLFVNPDVGHISEMLSRQPIRGTDLNCLARNVYVGNMNGFTMCV